MTTHVAALEMELHLPVSHSLKAKRAVLRPLIEGLRHRFAVAVAEVDHQDTWQRTTIAVAAVAGTPTHVTEVLDACERYVWSRPDVEVIECNRRWLDVP